MTVFTGADIVLPDRVLTAASLRVRDGVIDDIVSRRPDGAVGGGSTVVDLTGHIIVPGFVDVHLHGIEGVDVLDGDDAVAQVAARLPRHGVTAFCPTSVACPPAQLSSFLRSIRSANAAAAGASARALGAHLESNFLNPEWNGAQPRTCLRLPFQDSGADFSGTDILRVIDEHRDVIAIVTLAPEVPGGLDLVRHLVQAGIRVSLGHTGATYEEATAAIDAGARHATHLFNRMSSLTSRSPGVVGAVMASNLVTAEVICDGYHVHPSLVALAIRTKSISRVMAITDGTAAAGLPVGSRTRLGGHTIIAGEHTALLEDGTLAGSVLTMDAAFRMLLGLGLTLPEVARLCASTPAEALGRTDIGAIAAGNLADFVVLDRDFRVTQTWIGGVPALEP
jgi:N-acetylglucosamine-6-phosphate deacetylase